MPNGVCSNEEDPCTFVSGQILSRAQGLIPGLSQTLAKAPGQFVQGVAPTYLASGQGSHVVDVDGNEFLDYSMAVGPLVLGYRHPVVDDAIRDQLESGITFSLMHPLEVAVAERISRVIPNAEMVRFGKSGAEVTSAAVRLARAYTGRDRVVCCGYHGWHDWYIGTTTRPRGVPAVVRDLTYTIGYNDLHSVRSALESRDVACVILEPVTFEAPRDGFLERLHALCEETGTLLVFDEMWTGFRLAMGGAQERFGIFPDLACYSKAVANGMPLSVLTGRVEVMRLLEQDVFFYSTFGGEALSLAAALATLGEIEMERVPDHLARVGRRLGNGYNSLAEELDLPFTRCVGYDCRTMVTFDSIAEDPLVLKSFVQQELLRRGILWTGFHNVSQAHTDDDVSYTLSAYREVLTLLRDAVRHDRVRESLRGLPVEPVFRRTSHFDTKPVERPIPERVQ